VFRQEVEAEWAHLKDGPATLTAEEVARVESRFTRPQHERLAGDDSLHLARLAAEPAFAAWAKRNVHPHKVPGYAAVTLALKKTGVPPGDATAEQMDAVADLADRYSFGELRVSHEQNLILADVRQSDLHAVWVSAKVLGMATPNIGLITNIIACPGGDFCSLALAKSIPVAQAIQERFDDLDYVYDIGELDLNISGCMNSCGHHHVGHIGILGVDKKGEEFYQLTLGGSGAEDAAVGQALGPALPYDKVAEAVDTLVDVYLRERNDGERFLDTFRRTGVAPFKEAVYADAD
jgi:sulfite reductase (NADPH) hemoprotein beta-component